MARDPSNDEPLCPREELAGTGRPAPAVKSPEILASVSLTSQEGFVLS